MCKLIIYNAARSKSIFIRRMKNVKSHRNYPFPWVQFSHSKHDKAFRVIFFQAAAALHSEGCFPTDKNVSRNIFYLDLHSHSICVCVFRSRYDTYNVFIGYGSIEYADVNLFYMTRSLKLFQVFLCPMHTACVYIFLRRTVMKVSSL